MKPVDNIPRDAQLPGLQRVLDIPNIQRIFQERLENLDADRWVIERLRIIQFKYKPGRRCEVIFRIRCRERHSGLVERQILTGIVLPKGVAKHRFQEEKLRDYIRPAVGPSVQFFEDLGLIIWGFPNDPKMNRLHTVIQEDPLKTLISSHAEHFLIPIEQKLESIDTRIVKYVPHDRCTLQHRLQFARNGTTGSLSIFSKTYGRKTNARAIYHLLARLWEFTHQKGQTFQVPRPLLFHKESNTLFFQALKGEHILNIEQIDLNTIAEKCGVALADLQQAPLELTDFISRQREYTEFIESKNAIVRALPGFQQELEALERKIVHTFSRLQDVPVVPNHGAFRLTQFMLVDGNIAILDFDGFLMADAMLDVASFVTHVLYLSVKEELSPDACRQIVQTFCQSYRQRAPWGLAADVVTWFTACMLISKHAKKGIKLARVNKERMVQKLTELSHQLLDGTWTLA